LFPTSNEPMPELAEEEEGISSRDGEAMSSKRAL
jgi:hypothetical protein